MTKTGKVYTEDEDTHNVIEINIPNELYETFARIILRTFVGFLPNAKIEYKDGDKTNIASDNLTYKIEMISIDADNIMICKDRFKRIPGYPNHFISKYGVVYGREYHKFLKYKIFPNQYVQVGITNYDEEKPTRHFINLHRLVYITWGGEIPEGYHINHINSQPAINFVSNLEPMTRDDNTKYAHQYGYGRKPPTHVPGLWTESEIRNVCKHLVMGYTPTEIYNIMNLEGTISLSSFFTRCADVKNKRGDWKRIASEYDFSNAYNEKRERHYSQEIMTKVLDLVRAGMNHKDIANQVGINFRAIGDILKKYDVKDDINAA